MSDENRYFPPEDNHEAESDDGEPLSSDPSASTIFVEMMRQAAARRSTPPAPEQRPPEITPPRLPHVQRQPPDLTAALFGENVILPDDSASLPNDELASHPSLRSGEGAGAGKRTPRRNAPVLPEEAVIPPAAPPENVDAAPPRERPIRGKSRRPALRPEMDTPSLEPEAALTPLPAESAAESPVLQDEALEEQRIRRIQRRRERRHRRRAGIAGGFIRTALVVLIAAGLASTIFTWFTSPDFINPQVASDLQIAQSTGLYTAQPTALPTPNWLRKIGIVSGHRGPENDPGAVCEENGVVILTEAEVNFAVAQIVVQKLRARGFSVDLLDEFDARLDNYQAAALVSIHANTCKDWGERVSGFLVAKAAARPEGGLDTLLAECIAGTYGTATGLERRTTLTVDMTDYHSFREIHALTPAAIIELGFLKDDRELLTQHQEVLGQAITDGIMCFLEPRDRPSGEAITATPGAVPETATPGS